MYFQNFKNNFKKCVTLPSIDRILNGRWDCPKAQFLSQKTVKLPRNETLTAVQFQWELAETSVVNSVLNWATFL